MLSNSPSPASIRPRRCFWQSGGTGSFHDRQEHFDIGSKIILFGSCACGKPHKHQSPFGEKNAACTGGGIGRAEPRTECQMISFNRCSSAASASLKSIRADSAAP